MNIKETMLYKILKQHEIPQNTIKPKDYIDYAIKSILYSEILLFKEILEIFHQGICPGIKIGCAGALIPQLTAP